MNEGFHHKAMHSEATVVDKMVDSYIAVQILFVRSLSVLHGGLRS